MRNPSHLVPATHTSGRLQRSQTARRRVPTLGLLSRRPLLLLLVFALRQPEHLASSKPILSTAHHTQLRQGSFAPAPLHSAQLEESLTGPLGSGQGRAVLNWGHYIYCHPSQKRRPRHSIHRAIPPTDELQTMQVRLLHASSSRPPASGSRAAAKSPPPSCARSGTRVIPME